MLPPAGRDNAADRRSPQQDTDETRQCTSRDTHRPPPRPLTASHEYAPSPTQNSGAGAVSRFATSTSITWPCVRSARESGGRSPSTIPATSSRRRNSAATGRAPRRLVTTDSITTSTRGRSVRGLGDQEVIDTPGPTRLPNDTLVRLRDGPQTKRLAAATAGRARAAELDLVPRRRQPTPKPLLPLYRLRAAPTWNRQRPPGFLPLRSGQAVLRPPGDLAGRAQPARELDRRSDRTGRWSVAPTALDPLPPRTPQPTRTGPGG